MTASTLPSDHEPHPWSYDGPEIGARPAALRHVLRALASDPGFLRAPHEAIKRLRPRVDAERRRMARDFEIEGSSRERQYNWTRLVDGAVIGLTFLARLCVDAGARSAVAPFALMAVGRYGARGCDPDAALEIQCLLPEDQETAERGGRIFVCLCTGLAELGFEYRGAVGTTLECARTARCDPVVATRLATERFLSGQYALHAEFVGMCPPLALGSPSMPRGRTARVCGRGWNSQLRKAQSFQRFRSLDNI